MTFSCFLKSLLYVLREWSPNWYILIKRGLLKAMHHHPSSFWPLSHTSQGEGYNYIYSFPILLNHLTYPSHFSSAPYHWKPQGNDEMSWNNHQDSLWSEVWFQGFPTPEIHQGYQKMGSLTYFMPGQSASDYNEYLDYYFLYQLCYLTFFLFGFRT